MMSTLTSSSPVEMDLSHTVLTPDQELGDLDLPAKLGYGAISKIRVLHVANCQLTSLLTTPASSLSSVVRRLTVLHAPHNRLTTLHGVDAFTSLEVLDLSYNELRVVDAHGAALLRGLSRLRTLDLSHNHITVVDFCSLVDDGVASMHESILAPQTPPQKHARRLPDTMRQETGKSMQASADTMGLTSLNLSYNVLLELPDLRCMPHLELLDLNHNHLDDLSELDTRLPLGALHTLQLRCNRLDSVAALTPLSALANTLHHLQLYGNPLSPSDTTREAGGGANNNNGGHYSCCWWRPFVLWLAPLLRTLDTVPFSTSEGQVARRLFREHDGLSRRLIELLNAPHKSELESYLRVQCRGVQPPVGLDAIIRHLDGGETTDPHDSSPTEGSEAQVEVRGADRSSNNKHSVSATCDASQSNATSMVSPSDSYRRSVNGGSATAAPLAVVVQAMQQKLKSFAGVLETLWRADLVRRTFAAIVIQKYIRSALVRMHLDQETREYCHFIRHQLCRLRNPAVCVSAAIASLQQQQQQVITGTQRAGSEEGGVRAYSARDMQEILQSMRSLSQVMAKMYGDLDEFRAVVARERRRAAICVQRYYRGHLARRQWRVLRAGYEEFVRSLTPYAGQLQRLGRGYLVRRGLRERHARGLEVRQLTNEVQSLRAEVSEMRGLLMQCTRNSRRVLSETSVAAMRSPDTDAMRAADDLIARFATSRAADVPAAIDRIVDGGRSSGLRVTVTPVAADDATAVDMSQQLEHSMDREESIGSGIAASGQHIARRRLARTKQPLSHVKQNQTFTAKPPPDA